LKLVAKNGKRHIRNDAYMQPGKAAKTMHKPCGKSTSPK
jgi:hypothetical protein